MSALIIHPKDPTTDFLKPIYVTIDNKTVVDGGVTKTELKELIENHDRVIILGHGSPWGLMSVGQFLYSGNYIVDYTMVELLSRNKDNIYIWCHADQFVIKNQLSGFFTGMFISELIEVIYYDFLDLEQNTIEESNNGIAKIVSRFINEPLDVLYKNVIREYSILAKMNPIAKFNLERLFLTEIKRNSFKVCKT